VVPPPDRYAVSPRLLADLYATIARVTPDLLALLADGLPRSRAMIVAALADRHPRDDIKRTLMRLAVTERPAEPSGKYPLPGPAPWPDQD